MITEALGIKGWGSVNDRMLLTSIITGDPLLMINLYGNGKTAIVDRLGQVIVNQLKKYRPDEKLSAAVINAATANPQDWAGYLIPPENRSEGQMMVLVESPQSLLNCVLIAIDEIGRTQPRNQNNVLTLIQERRVDGMQTKCEIMFGMMNPVMSDNIDEGSEPLIGPLADRFALLIKPPEFKEMTMNNKKEVILSAYKPSSSQSMLTDPTEKKFGKDSYVVKESTADNLWEFFTKSKELYLKHCFDSGSDKIIKSVVEYVALVIAQLVESQATAAEELYVSGRRAGFLTRAILANHAIGNILGRGDLPAAAQSVLLQSMMNEAMGRGINPQRLISAHGTAVKVLKSGASVMANIMSEPDKWKRLRMGHHQRLSPDNYTRLYKDLCKMYADNSSIDVVIGFALMETLSKKMAKHELAEIGRKIIDVCYLPVKRFAIDGSSGEALEVAIKMQSGCDDVNVSRMTALAQYIHRRSSVKIEDAWNFVEKNYKKALIVLNNERFEDEV